MQEFAIFESEWKMSEKHDKHWLKHDYYGEWFGYEGYLWMDTPVRDCAYRNNLLRKGNEHRYKDDKYDIATLQDKLLGFIKSFPDWVKQIMQNIKDALLDNDMNKDLDNLQQQLKAMQNLATNDHQIINKKSQLQIGSDKPKELCRFKPYGQKEKSPQNIYFGIFYHVEQWIWEMYQEIYTNSDWFIKQETR